jgi:hemolysin III
MAGLPEWIGAGEETVNALTHLPGAIASVIALVLLMVRATQFKDVYRTVSYLIFGTSLVNLYTMSTCYHCAKSDKVKRILRSRTMSASTASSLDHTRRFR